MTVQLRTVIPSIFNQIRPSSTMLAIRGYRNNFDELADYSLVFHVNYLNAIKRSKQIIEQYKPLSGLEKIARSELLESYAETLSGKGNSRDTSSHAYEPIIDGTGEAVNGVRWHSNYTRVYLYGFICFKRVITPGNYPEVNHEPLTMSKNKLRALTPSNKFRQFILIDGRFDKVDVEKMQLTHLDLIRELI